MKLETWLEYFTRKAEEFDFKPWIFEGEDKNLRAFSSKKNFIEWYGQPPGKVGEPYRDEGFYTREFTNISRFIRPKNIVELGTSLGIGSIILRILNPTAKIISVDNRKTQYLPGNIEVETGFLSKLQNIDVKYILSDTKDFVPNELPDLWFIDADHSYENVLNDSELAYKYGNENKCTIVWHDYNLRHSGVIQAVREFCKKYKLQLIEFTDSSTVWTYWS